MPILDVDKAQNIIVIKRSMKPGFAGIDNDLYLDPKTAMLFGDAKDAVGKVVQELKRPRKHCVATLQHDYNNSTTGHCVHWEREDNGPVPPGSITAEPRAGDVVQPDPREHRSPSKRN